ncbi:MAG: hypothetical protein Q9218_005192 [Villophora microphyllina]
MAAPSPNSNVHRVPKRPTLQPSHVAQFQYKTKAPLSSTPARFSTGVDDKETSNITPTGPFIVTGNMKKLHVGRYDPHTFQRYKEEARADDFKYGSDENVIATLSNELNMVAEQSFKKPTRESIVDVSSLAGTYRSQQEQNAELRDKGRAGPVEEPDRTTPLTARKVAEPQFLLLLQSRPCLVSDPQHTTTALTEQRQEGDGAEPFALYPKFKSSQQNVHHFRRRLVESFAPCPTPSRPLAKLKNLHMPLWISRGGKDHNGGLNWLAAGLEARDVITAAAWSFLLVVCLGDKGLGHSPARAASSKGGL